MTDTIVEEVVKKFQSRSKLGIEKYGTTLDRDDLSIEEWLDNAIEESMDLILYLYRVKKDIIKWEQNKLI
jgi:hypothetical protein